VELGGASKTKGKQKHWEGGFLQERQKFMRWVATGKSLKAQHALGKDLIAGSSRRG